MMMNYFLTTNFEAKLLAMAALLFLKITFLPSIPLLMYMTIAMILDFITGVIKAKMAGQARTSAGYRRTIVKFLQYGGSIAVGIILANISEGKGGESFKAMLNYINDGLLVFIIYIEVTSIFENLYAIDNRTVLSRLFIAPILKILTWQINNNPLVKKLEEVSKEKEADNAGGGTN